MRCEVVQYNTVTPKDYKLQSGVDWRFDVRGLVEPTATCLCRRKNRAVEQKNTRHCVEKRREEK